MAVKPVSTNDKQRIRELENTIAENQKSIDDLKREKLFSEKVLDSLPGIFYLYNENGDMIRWNKNHETLTGYSAEQLPHIHIYEWFSPEDADRVARVVNTILKTGELMDVEARLIIRNGETRPYYFTGYRMVVDGNKYLLGMGIDLTEKKKIEEALRKSEEKYRTIFENAVEGIFQTTPEGRLVSANPAMANMLGYDSSEELVRLGTDISTSLYVSPSDRLELIQRLGKNQVISGYEVRFFKKDGSTIWVSLHVRPVTDSTGVLRLLEGIAFDITDQKREADALKEREECLRKENLRLRNTIKDRYRFGDIVGKSEPMQEVYEMILKAAATDANVIIYGESGTGKELVAKAIHAFSDRKSGPFVPVNCGAIPENLLESEFFGYKKGAFTGAAADKDGYLDSAHGGVLFLDELGEIGSNLQVKLLRVLEGGGFTRVGGVKVQKPDVRIIAATNRNLTDFVNRGVMREDFYYRIHIIPIHLPPLRDRKEDIPLLVEHFTKMNSTKTPIPQVTGEILESLRHHYWPGNVRELQNVLHRYRTLSKIDIPQRIGPPSEGTPSRSMPENRPGESFESAMNRAEKEFLVKALDANRWHREAAAKHVGMATRTFYRKLKRHGLTRQD